MGFLTDRVIEHLSAKGPEPWFVHVSYLAPHPPFIASAPYNAMYDPDEVPPPVRAPAPEEEARQHPFLAWHLRNQRGSGIAFDHDARDNLALGERDIRQARANYYGMMSEVDAHIGRLLASLRASGEDDHTLVVFASDHGEHLGDHWQFSKLSYFDQTYHVPLIVRDPRPTAAPGRQVDAFDAELADEPRRAPARQRATHAGRRRRTPAEEDVDCAPPELVTFAPAGRALGYG